MAMAHDHQMQFSSVFRSKITQSGPEDGHGLHYVSNTRLVKIINNLTQRLTGRKTQVT